MPRKRRGGSRGGSGNAHQSPGSDNRSTPGKQSKHETPQNDQVKGIFLIKISLLYIVVSLLK